MAGNNSPYKEWVVLFEHGRKSSLIIDSIILVAEEFKERYEASWNLLRLVKQA